MAREGTRGCCMHQRSKFLKHPMKESEGQLSPAKPNLNPSHQQNQCMVISDGPENLSLLLRTTLTPKNSKSFSERPRAGLQGVMQTRKQSCLRLSKLQGPALDLPLTLQPGHFSFSFLEMPVMVPPVPAVATSMSIFPV